MSTVDVFMSHVRREVQAQVAQSSKPKRGLVTSVDASQMRVKVRLEPESSFAESQGLSPAFSPWLPVMSLSVGNGWGILAAPVVGTQVIILPVDNDIGAAALIGAHWSLADVPPVGHNPGEFWLYHETGSFLKLTNDGKVSIKDPSGSQLTFNNNNTIDMTGPVNITGDLNVTGDVTISGTLTLAGIVMNSHVHPDPQGGVTGGPQNA